MQEWIYIVFGGLIGMCMGSFTSATLGRANSGISLTKPSCCDACGKQIQPWRNIPILTWLFQRGRGACCGAQIPASVVGVEVAGLLLGALAGALFGMTGLIVFPAATMILVLLWWFAQRKRVA